MAALPWNTVTWKLQKARVRGFCLLAKTPGREAPELKLRAQMVKLGIGY